MAAPRARVRNAPTLFDLIDRAQEVYDEAFEGAEKSWPIEQGKTRTVKQKDLAVCLKAIDLQARLCGYLNPKDDRQQLPPDEIRARLTAAITADPVWREELAKALKGKT